MNSGYTVVALIVLMFASFFGLVWLNENWQGLCIIGSVVSIIYLPFLLINDGATWI
jgi:hypothetical protein